MTSSSSRSNGCSSISFSASVPSSATRTAYPLALRLLESSLRIGASSSTTRMFCWVIGPSCFGRFWSGRRRSSPTYSFGVQARLGTGLGVPDWVPGCALLCLPPAVAGRSGARLRLARATPAQKRRLRRTEQLDLGPVERAVVVQQQPANPRVWIPDPIGAAEAALLQEIDQAPLPDSLSVAPD